MKIDNRQVWEGDVMPIGGYYGPIASYTDEAQGYTSENFLQDKYFQMIADCGVNLIVSAACSYDAAPEDFIKTMELCNTYQIRICVKDGGIKPEMTIEDMEKRMELYSGYDSFAGISIVDEPNTEYFPKKFQAGGTIILHNHYLKNFRELMIKINSIEGQLGYVNLLPHYCWMETDIADYQRYVDEYCDTCQPIKVISFDYYVFDMENRENIREYFANLSIIREAAKRLGVPFWTMVQCGGQWNDGQRRFESKPYFPLDGEFIWNVNTCLAMGAKGIQYFPLIQPHFFALAPDGIDPKRNGLIGADGNPTQWYEYAKKANTQIMAVDEVLMNAEHLGVLALGKAEEHVTDIKCLLEGTAFRELVSVEADGAGVLVGCFDYRGKTALYVVNYDMYEAQEITLKLDGVHQLLKISGKGTDISSSDCASLVLEKGEAMLFVID